MDLKLKGCRAFVLGSSRGLGYAVARGLAREGVDVAINGRNTNDLKQAAKNIMMDYEAKVIPIPGDVTESDFAREGISQAVTHLGGLDLLVTNAGGPPSGKFEEIEDHTWNTAVQLSFLSHVRVIREALPLLRRSKTACVLTITSYSVKQPIPNLILSNSIRAATIGLTKSLALELGPERIRFNSILPGWTETERVTELMRYRANLSGKSIQEEIDQQMAENPLGRMGTTDEFANAAVFLLSPAAGYINGVMLNVDGGMYKGIL